MDTVVTTKSLSLQFPEPKGIWKLRDKYKPAPHVRVVDETTPVDKSGAAVRIDEAGRDGVLITTQSGYRIQKVTKKGLELIDLPNSPGLILGAGVLGDTTVVIKEIADDTIGLQVFVASKLVNSQTISNPNFAPPNQAYVSLTKKYVAVTYGGIHGSSYYGFTTFGRLASGQLTTIETSPERTVRAGNKLIFSGSGITQSDLVIAKSDTRNLTITPTFVNLSNGKIGKMHTLAFKGALLDSFSIDVIGTKGGKEYMRETILKTPDPDSKLQSIPTPVIKYEEDFEVEAPQFKSTGPKVDPSFKTTSKGETFKISSTRQNCQPINKYGKTLCDSAPSVEIGGTLE